MKKVKLRHLALSRSGDKGDISMADVPDALFLRTVLERASAPRYYDYVLIDNAPGLEERSRLGCRILWD